MSRWFRLSSLITGLFGASRVASAPGVSKASKRPASRATHYFRPMVEFLEDRLAPADTSAPTAFLNPAPPNVTVAGATPNTVTVDYNDDVAINSTTIGFNDITITGCTVTGVSINGSGASVQVT